MPDETDTTPPPQDSSFKIPSWVWFVLSVVVIGIGIVIAILIIAGGSSDEDSDDEAPGGGEEEEQVAPSVRTKEFESVEETITLTNASENDRIKTIVLFQIPDDVKEIKQLNVRFDRTHTSPPSTAIEGFQYLLFNILEKDGKTSLDPSWVNCQDWEWKKEDCRARVLHDFSSAEGYDYKFTEAALTFDQSSTTLSNEKFLEKLEAGRWLKLLMRISEDKHSGVLSNIKTTLTYSV